MATGFAADQPKPKVDKVPFAQTGTISDTNVLTVTFLNMTDHITVRNANTATTSTLKVGFTATGVAAAAYVALNTGESITLDVRSKQICLLKSAGSSVVYSITGALSRLESQDYPDITTANGFEKV
ncbi:hypothetical protein [Acinetobacter sp.]|jgi:hypothetical protein|uniref:hypothetical protein n=1 Tax=Acinetobacter sp. TaxID=472 RepID=UPI000C09243F|nr:hypothetical protein [Acinetobacter sp.]MAK31345.1 hypothetical protein [Acinetobacter sp.]|tara:strand:- start:84 stop:461 length:378 start_codon:yes stop_codon:yes gene_type:complete